MKLEKKQLTMEEFLKSLDMSNLRTMLENDSDYGDEVDPESISISAASM